MILVLGKARNRRVPNLGCRGAESPGWFGLLPKFSPRDLMHKRVHCCDEAANHQLVAHSCAFLSHPNGFFRRMFKLNAKFDTDSLLYSLSHFECGSHTAHMLTQQSLPPPLTSAVKSSCSLMLIPVHFTYAHSSPLSLATRLHRCRSSKPFLLY